MQTVLKILSFTLLVVFTQSSVSADELSDYWSAVSKTIKTGDLEGYRATYHPDAIYVDGIQNISYPIAEAFVRWKPGFDDTAAGKMEASVDFRFSDTRRGENTAHQTGMFHYSFDKKNGEAGEYFVHFEALLVKKDGWKLMMEYQKEPGTRADWDKLGE